MAAAPLAAQEQTPRVLSLDEALEITLSGSPVIDTSRYEEKAAQQERRAAIGLRMPQISVGGAYTYLGKDIGFDFNDLKGPVENITHDILGSGLIPTELLPQNQQLLTTVKGAAWFLKLQDRSLGFVGGQVTLPIYMGGKINTANRAAKINEKTDVEQGNQSRTAKVSELVERYYGLALARQVVEVRQQVVDGVGRHLKDAIALEKNGMIPHSERLYVEFKMAEAERELQNARLQVETIASALNNTLGQQAEVLPVTTMFVLGNLEDVAYYKDLAAKFNPLLSQVALKRQLAKEGVRLQRADFLPQVAAMGGASFYNYQVTKIMPRWAVGVGVNLKIFDGLNREYKYSAAKQTVKQVEVLEMKAGKDIAVLIEKLYNQMNNYANQMKSIDASLAFAEEYLKAKNAAFLEGMSSSSDLVDAELNLAKVRTERMQAAYNYDVALAKLLEAAGISDEFISYLHRTDARPIHFDNEQKQDLMKKSTIVTIILIASVVVLGVIFISWYLRKATPLYIQGTVECTTYKASSKVPGRIEEMKVEEGQHVNKGELLYTLSTPELNAKLQQAAAVKSAASAMAQTALTGARIQQKAAALNLWEKAQAGLLLAQKTFDRVNNLYEQGVVPAQKLDEARANLQAMQATERAAKAQCELVFDGASKEEKEAAAAQVRQAEGAVSEMESYL